MVMLYLQVDSRKEGSWSGGTVDEASIAIHTFVYVGLEVIQKILYACVNLQGVVFVERNVVADFDVPFEKSRSSNLLILWHISCKVLHEHIACHLAVGNNVEMFYGFDVTEEIAIVLWSTEHAALWGNVWIVAPLQWFDIAAVVVGVTCLEGEQVTKAHLSFNVHTCHARATGVCAR